MALRLLALARALLTSSQCCWRGPRRERGRSRRLAAKNGKGGLCAALKRVSLGDTTTTQCTAALVPGATVAIQIGGSDGQNTKCVCVDYQLQYGESMLFPSQIDQFNWLTSDTYGVVR
jgi:hypothetical protein